MASALKSLGALPPPSALRRSLSAGSDHGSSANLTKRGVPWQTFSTIEERQSVREKIRQSYTAQCLSYSELLAAAVAVEEELVFVNAPSRLDYFKSGFLFSDRLANKRKEIAKATRDSSAAEDDDVSSKQPAAKRAKAAAASSDAASS